MNRMTGTETQTEMPYNTKRLNEEDSWKKVTGRKRNRNSP